MKINQRISKLTQPLLICFIILGLASCGNDDDPEPVKETTVEEDRQNIQNSFDAVVHCVETFKNGPAVNVLFREFLGLSEGEIFNEEWIENVEAGLDAVISLDNIEENDRFDINFYAGTYSYNIDTDTWSKANDQSGQVVFKFPSGPEATSNNATLTISNYSDEAATIESETLYLPKKATVNLDVDGVTILHLKLNDVTYASNADFEIPVKVDFEIYMNPFTLSLVVGQSTTKDFELSLNLTDGNDCNIGVDVTAKLNSDDYENITENNIESVTVVVTANDLKVQTLTGIAELLKLEDPTENDINTLIDLDVLFKDIKIADLKWDENGQTVIIFYKDGTSEDTSNFYDEFVEDIKSIFDEFFGS